MTKKEKAEFIEAFAKGLQNSVKSERGVRKSFGDIEVGESNVSIAKYLKGAIFNDWQGADNEKRIYKTFGQDGGAQGGFLVPEQLAGGVIELLKDESVIRKMPGIRTVNMKGPKLSYAAVENGPQITWGSENATISEDTSMDFGKKVLEVSKATCIYKMSRELLDNADAAEDVIRAELAAQIALEEDRVFLEGTGGTEPLGIYYNPRVQSTDLNGSGIGFDDILEANYQLRTSSSKLTGFIAPPVIEYQLEKLKDAEGNYILGSQNDNRYSTIDLRTLYGRPLGITNEMAVTNMPDADETYIVCGNWRDFIIGENRGLRIETSMHSYDAFYRDQVHLRVIKHVGILLRHPESFVVIKGISTS